MNFSFCMPAYKAEYIRESIESILSQSFVDFELIILNDASPDNLEDVVLRYNDDRIRYYANESNIGSKSLVAQWNKCLSYAKNEYVILASDDDIYDKNFLFHMAQMIKKYPVVDVFHSRVQIISGEGTIIDYSPACGEWESCQEFIWHRICKERSQYVPEFVFRRKALMDKGGFIDFPSAWGSDHATSFLLAKERGVVCCNLPLFKWRYSGLNISSSGNFVDNKVEGLFQYHNWLKQFVAETDDSFFKGLIETGLKKYLDKRLVALLSQHTFLFLLVKLFNPGIKNKRIRKKHLLYGLVFKIKNMITPF